MSANMGTLLERSQAFKNLWSLYGYQTTKRLFRLTKGVSEELEQEIQNAIDKIGSDVPGSSTSKGFLYHDYALPHFGQKTHRKMTWKRIKKIVSSIDVEGKAILDIGCSCGGISTGLSLFNAKSVFGIDYDEKSIVVAKLIARKFHLNNIEFVCGDVTKAELPQVDCIVWLSNWMWIVKAVGMDESLKLLYSIPEKTGAKEMIFESAANEGGAAIEGTTQEDIYRFLVEHSGFAKIENLGPFDDSWRKPHKRRDVFRCTQPRYNRK